MAPTRADRPWVPPTTADGEIVAGDAPKAAANEDNYVLPRNQQLGPRSAAAPCRHNAKVYSPPDLIDLAQTNNPSTRVAWNEARTAALATGIAESTYLPLSSVSAIGGIQGSNGSQSVAASNFNTSESASGTVSAVSLQWLLFDFGQRAAVVEAAKQASVISNIAFTAAHQQVIYNVTVAFYAHAAARARLATASQSLRNAQTIQAARGGSLQATDRDGDRGVLSAAGHCPSQSRVSAGDRRGAGFVCHSDDCDGESLRLRKSASQMCRDEIFRRRWSLPWRASSRNPLHGALTC